MPNTTYCKHWNSESKLKDLSFMSSSFSLASGMLMMFCASATHLKHNHTEKYVNPAIVVRIYDTFVNNFGNDYDLLKYLKESC